MIGRFIVIDQLGAGAGGVVVSAYDPDLDRKVALKVLRPEQVFSGSVGRARERLLREAKAVARITHPNIVTVHEVGSVGDQVFVAMEYVDGGTLRDTLGLRRRQWRQAIDLLLPAARGLAAAHAAGMVHRDFKPANVLVSRESRVVVTDFGLVSTHQEQDDDVPDGEPAPQLRDPSLTDTGTTLGTPAYMAPEQHRGADVDARSDQFAFCVTLFEAVYGQRPFTGNTLLDLMKAKESGDFIRTSGNDVPSWLRNLVLRGMSSAPERRFSSMADLIGEIERHLVSRTSRGWIGLASLALIVPAAVIGYRSLTTTPQARGDDPRVGVLQAELTSVRAELTELKDELKDETGQMTAAIDPAAVAALNTRIRELEDQLRATEVSPEPARPRPAKHEFPISDVSKARKLELHRRKQSGPPLPETPESNIVASVFSGLRPAIERCANIPDLQLDRNYEEWKRLMDRSFDSDIRVTIKIEPDGRASKVRVAAQSTSVRSCISLSVRRARFPVSIEGGPASYSYSLIE